MSKLNRQIDEQRMNRSKEKSIDFVMDHITGKSSKKSFGYSIPLLSLVTTIAIIIVVALTNRPGVIDNDPVVLSNFESQKLAEISYISGSLVSANITVSNSSIMFLSDEETTEFESNTEEINLYFDMLKVFLEDDVFTDSVTVTELTDEDFDYLLEFTQNNLEYRFYILIAEESITGELNIGDAIFDVAGKFEESDTELKIELKATSGDDFVNIKYITESEDEVETKFEISQSINGIESDKQVKISKEDNEQKVVIEQGEDEYTLKKEFEDNQTKYKLEYSINGVEGEARITEEVDNEGNVSYNYQITENGKQKEINSNKPDYKGNSGNNGNGNGNGNRQNESNDEERKSYINFI